MFWGFVDYAQTLLDSKHESRLMKAGRDTGEYLVRSGPALESEPAGSGFSGLCPAEIEISARTESSAHAAGFEHPQGEAYSFSLSLWQTQYSL